MDNSIVDKFYNTVMNSKSPSAMVSFARESLGLSLGNKSIYGALGKLIRLYGKERVFFAILDCAMMENIDSNGIHRLIAYFAKKRLESVAEINYESLEEFANKSMNSLSKKRNLKIKSPFNE